MNITRLIIGLIVLGWPSIAFSGEHEVDPREARVDRVLGSMEEGSRILSPQGTAVKNQRGEIPGGGLSPAMDTRVTASGGVQASAIQGAAGAFGGGAGPSGGSPDGASVISGGAEPAVDGGIGAGGGGVEPEVGTQEPVSEPEPVGEQGMEDSIIDIDADVTIGGGGVDADAGVTIDPTAGGGLLDADLASDIAVEEPVSDTLVDSSLAAEVGVTDSVADGEADAGLEADVEGASEGDVAETDPASGLSSDGLL